MMRITGKIQMTDQEMQAMLPRGVKVGEDALTGILQSVESNEAVVVIGADDPFAESITNHPAPGSGPLKHIATLPSGVWIYRQTNGVGGHRYWSDAIGGGAMIWDTVLASEEELLRVIELERERRKAEG